MADQDNDRAQRAEQGERDRQSNAQAGQGDDAASSGGAVSDQDENRRGLAGRGFDAGTGYGGAGNASAYSGESSYGGQAGYGGSTTHGAYSDGKFGRDQTHLHADTDGGDIDPSAGERGRGAKGGLEE